MRALIFAALLAAGSAHAAQECLPASVGGTGGALKTTVHGSGALIFTWRCTNGAGQFIVAPAKWEPKVPADKAELQRLGAMVDYSDDPNYLRDAALAILATN